MKIDISGKDKALVLVALFNASKPLGMEANRNVKPMTVANAREMLKKTSHFDYIEGRSINVKLDGDMLDTSLYDCDNGKGAAERALSDVF